LPGVRISVSAGVQYGKLIEPFRIHMEDWHEAGQPELAAKIDAHRMTPYAGRMRLAPRGAVRPVDRRRLAMKKLGMYYLMPRSLRQMRHAAAAQRTTGVPEVTAGQGPRRACHLFTDVPPVQIFPETNLATARPAKNGCEVWTPRPAKVAARHYHARTKNRRRRSGANVETFSRLGNEVDAIIDAAGCGACSRTTRLFHGSPEEERRRGWPKSKRVPDRPRPGQTTHP
jgi:glycolate oxidase iron-sulfur subunit